MGFAQRFYECRFRPRASLGRIFIRAAAATLFVLVLLWLFGWTDKHTEVVVEIQSHAGTKGEIFYAEAGQVYGQDRRIEFAIESDGQWHTYKINIPGNRGLDHIRVDPGSESGSVAIRRVTVAAAGYHVDLAGRRLSTAVESTNSMTLEAGDNEFLRFSANAPDPYVSFKLPDIKEGVASQLGRWLGAIALTAVAVFWLLFAGMALPRIWQRISQHGGLSNALNRTVFRAKGSVLLLVPLTYGTLWGMATALELGCPSTACMSSRNIGHGIFLTLAALGFAIVGASALSILNRTKNRSSRPTLFLWMMMGQATLILYIYLRSLLVRVLTLPVTRVEILLIIAACLFFVIRKTRVLQGMFGSPVATCGTLVKITALAFITMWISDRELPRLVMLSSDPDIHEFFAKLIERLGAVPWMTTGWRAGALDYPAGSPVLIYIWSLISGLGVGNSLAALPLLQCLSAALLIAEAISMFAASAAKKFVLLITLLGVTFAGFLFPLYDELSYMQGVGRQESEGLVALVCVMLLAHSPMGITSERALTLVMTVAIFCLGALNPINVIIPSVLIGAYVAVIAVREKRLSLVVFAPVLTASLLMLDPYYFSLFFVKGGDAVQKIGLATNLRHMSVNEILTAWFSSVKNGSEALRLLVTFSAYGQSPSFFVMFLSFSAPLVLSIKYFKHNLSPILFSILVIFFLWFLSSVFSAVQNDARFYLLAPYFEFSLTQYKIALLTVLAGLSIVVAQKNYGKLLKTSFIAIAMIILTFVIIRSAQKLRLEPRFSYCGSMGCSATSDLVVLKKFAAGLGLHVKHGKILVPNSVNQMGAEKWIFPADGARLLPEYTDIPLAFYYYHGDYDYTTSNYEDHVCKILDRRWLLSKNIRYIFLPANRAAACVSSMESLPSTEHVIARSGNSYLLELR